VRSVKREVGMQVKKQTLAPARVHLSNGVGRVHVVGVAGSGLRALVQLLHERGYKVTGSELLESPVLEKFRLRGIDCRVGHSSGNVDQGTNLVLISAAVSDSNPEVKAALDRRIPVVKYSECLGELMAEKSGIAVAGTHGKTTTTAMVSFILSEAGLDPTFVIGGEHPGLGGSARWGTGPHFVAEACEFDRSFLNLRPRMSIVTNIEEDHLDYFQSLKDIQGAFADFVSLLPEDGELILNRDDPHSAYLSEFCRSAVATFSLRPGAADWWAEEIVAGEAATELTMVHREERARVSLRVPGAHNIQNALAAAAVARRAGVPLEKIAGALSAFTCVRRRFDVLARGKIVVVDDYAHHPTEVLSVLRAARQRLPARRLIAVFQPHQHSRLRRFGGAFAGALAGFDASIVTDVFSARDKDEDRSFKSDALVEALLAADPRARAIHAPRFDDVLLALRAEAAAGDAVIFMGAGSITDLARTYALEVQGD
jgi:UDP-N-acetylmuramate--alanine ligase